MGDRASADLVMDAFAVAPGDRRRTLPISRQAMVSLAIFFFPFLIVFLFHESIVTAHDPGNFVLAIENDFDAFAERPHTPGYPFFVILWRLLATAGFSSHQCILIGNALFAGIGLLATRALLRDFVDKRTATMAFALVAFNPMIWFYASTGEIYVFDVAFSALAILALRRSRLWLLPVTWFVIGLASGFRLSSFVLLYPAFLLTEHLRAEAPVLRKRAIHQLCCVLGVLVWLIPFMFDQRGISGFIALMHAAGDLVGTPAEHATVYLTSAIWMLHLGLMVIAVTFWKRTRVAPRDWMVLAVWILIPTAFFVLRHYMKGYILLLLPAYAVIIADRLRTLSPRTQRIVSASMALAGPLIFFAIPYLPPSTALDASPAMRDRVATAGFRALSFYAPTNAHLRAREVSMHEALSVIRGHSAPGDTVILHGTGMTAHPRTVQYHIPDRVFIIPKSGGTAAVQSGIIKLTKQRFDDYLKGDSKLIVLASDYADALPVLSQFEQVYNSSIVDAYRIRKDQYAVFRDEYVDVRVGGAR